MSRLLTSLAWIALGSMLAQPASAYLCSRVPPAGPSLYWATRAVPYAVNQHGCQDVAGDAEFDAARASFMTWEEVACSDLGFVEQAPTDGRLAGYDWANPDANENLIVWREGDPGDPADSWRHERGSIAVTTTTFNSRTGELLDADIEFNAEVYTFTACTPPEPGCTVAYDIQNTLTHEIGHVFGLDHPPVSQPAVIEATMYHSAPRGEIKKRDLASDDIDGLCFIYPAGAEVGQCFEPVASSGPEPVFSQVGSDPDTGCLCRGQPGPGSANGAFWAWAMILALAVWRRLA